MVFLFAEVLDIRPKNPRLLTTVGDEEDALRMEAVLPKRPPVKRAVLLFTETTAERLTLVGAPACAVLITGKEISAKARRYLDEAWKTDIL